MPLGSISSLKTTPPRVEQAPELPATLWGRIKAIGGDVTNKMRGLLGLPGPARTYPKQEPKPVPASVPWFQRGGINVGPLRTDGDPLLYDYGVTLPYPSRSPVVSASPAPAPAPIASALENDVFAGMLQSRPHVPQQAPTFDEAVWQGFPERVETPPVFRTTLPVKPVAIEYPDSLWQRAPMPQFGGSVDTASGWQDRQVA